MVIIMLWCGVANAELVLKGGNQCNTKPPIKIEWVEELTSSQVHDLEAKTKAWWITCPICYCNYLRGEYFTNHKSVHITKHEVDVMDLYRGLVTGETKVLVGPALNPGDDPNEWEKKKDAFEKANGVGRYGPHD